MDITNLLFDHTMKLFTKTQLETYRGKLSDAYLDALLSYPESRGVICVPDHEFHKLKYPLERDPISTMTMDQLREAIEPLLGGREVLAKQQAAMESNSCLPCGKKAARLALCEWYRKNKP